MKVLRGKGLAIFVILLCILYMGYRIYAHNSGAATLREETLAGAIPTVSIINPKPLPPTETITLPGNFRGWYEAPIYAQVSGYVKMWYTDYGAKVKKGDILATINVPTLDAQYRQAKADLASERALYGLAQLTAKRYLALREKHAVSAQSISVKVAEAKAQAAKVNAAEQQVRNFEALIRFKTIVAPFDGVVIDRNINVGDYVNKEGTISDPNAISNLFTVAVVSKMRLFVSVPESFGAFLKPGLTAEVTVPQLPSRRFTAKFLTVASAFDVSTRTAVTEFVLDNEDRALWPGSFAKVQLTTSVNSDFLTIPTSAMVFQENGTEVAVLTDDDRVHFKSITVGKILDATVEVTEGITPTDRIVNNPSAALLENDQVRIVTPAPGYNRLNTDAPMPKAQIDASISSGQADTPVAKDQTDAPIANDQSSK
ncbi:efflux RND transporter periplasmic adaptor subunit [Candidatus Nitrospira neomarina]|uniref:Efflux RND transporter periplasmic adaptor subunit n=1 Tax=Candidatus Nitrospira neomarina TaxID=3020899 RepID=A0AA96GKG0_9BACT|nr:efflux RND transporter periplasmic adaptor subunit [Candidatus Nitrospira neomarina]WNM62933.1 efflux RND transporter periplasmic adaptor subunit [Candidatus Nitrospira neomarina]